MALFGTSVEADAMLIMNTYKNMCWLLWEVAPCFPSLSIWLKTLQYCFDNEMTSSILEEETALDMLLDHYTPLLSGSGLKHATEEFEVQTTLITLILNILLNYGNHISKRVQITVHLFDILMDAMRLSDTSCQVHMFRILTEFYLKSLPILTNVNQSVFLLLLLQHAPKGSVIRTMAIKFIMGNIPEQFDWNSFGKIIKLQGVTAHEDLLLLEAVLRHKKNKEYKAEPIRLMMQAAVTDSILTRTATFLVATSLIEIGDNSAVEAVIEEYVVKCYCYLYFAHKQSLMTVEGECVLNFLNEIGRFKIEFFVKKAKECHGTLAKLKLLNVQCLPQVGVCKQSRKSVTSSTALEQILLSVDPTRMCISEIFRGKYKITPSRSSATSRSQSVLAAFQ